MIPTEQLIEIRHKLHQYPETSRNEENTTKIILHYLKQFQPTTLITNIAGNSLAAVYTSNKPGKTIALRAELDALSIPEQNTIKYHSKNTGISHACGHDGHMTILLGIAAYLHHHPEKIQGKIILLFQAAEEIAAGAHQLCTTPFYQQLKPDYIFALHNLPGYAPGTILIKKGIFAIASQGLIIQLTGATAHAGHPEQGNNPVFGMTEIINKINSISNQYHPKHKQAMITIIHLNLGEVAFGTTPGTATIMATFRAPNNNILKKMSQHCTRAITTTADQYKLQHTIKWVEKFPATKNNPNAVKLIEKAAKKQNIPLTQLKKPFSWTEDFSYFLQKTPGALFGLGSGKNHAPLHSQTYDFPDKILKNGINIFLELIRQVNQT